jgi:hypothetical protein
MKKVIALLLILCVTGLFFGGCSPKTDKGGKINGIGGGPGGADKSNPDASSDKTGENGPGDTDSGI